MSAADALRAERVQKRFGGVKALESVDITVPTGQIRGLIGPNGAGKSTLLGILSGALPPDEGRVWFGPHELTGRGRVQAARVGVMQTFQQASPFPGLTVRENVLVGLTRHLDPSATGMLFRLRHVRSAERAWGPRIDAVLDAFGLSEVAETDAADLSFGQLRMLEIARAMVAEPRVLLLDEPAAGLNAQEAARVGDVLKRLKAEGLGILVVDHDVRFLFNLCDDIVAMDYGRVIAEGPPDAIERDPQVRAAYLAVDTKGGA